MDRSLEGLDIDDKVGSMLVVLVPAWFGAEGAVALGGSVGPLRRSLSGVIARSVRADDPFGLSPCPRSPGNPARAAVLQRLYYDDGILEPCHR